MEKPLKIILSIVAGIVLLLVLIAGAAFLLIQPNNFKPEIIAAVKQKTGRNLVIDGDLKLAIFPALGLSTGKMTLSNMAGFEQASFASLEQSHINVELLPLLSKKIEITGVTLNGLILNLVQNQQGIGNWEDLTARKTPPSVSTGTQSQQQITTAATVGTAAVLSSFSMGAISIENAQVNWQDLQTGKNLQIKELQMNTGKANFNQPINVGLAYVVDNAETKITQTVKLSTLLTVNEQLDSFALSHFSVTLTRRCVAVNEQRVTTGDSIPNKSFTSVLTIADSSVSLSQQMLKVTGLQLKAGDLMLDADISAEHLQDNNEAVHGKISVAEFNLAKFMKDFAITAPVMRDATALNKLAISVNVSATKNSLDLQNLALKLDDSTISGSTSIKNFAVPAVNFDLAVDTLDIDRYAPSVNKNQKSNMNRFIALTAGAALLPVETLRTLNVNGNLAVANLKVNNLKLQDVQLALAAKDGLVNSTQTVKQFYQGEYSGNLIVDARKAQTSLAIDEKINHIQVEPFLQDLNGKAVMRGTVDAAAQLLAKGNTQAELQSSLGGTVSFANKDGAIIGFSLQKIIDKGKSLIKGTDLTVDSANNEETPFQELSGTASIQNSVLTNRDLVARTKKVRITGNGTANLNTEQLDYKLMVNWLNPAQEIPPIGINVAGTFTNPSYKLDVSALLTDNAKTKVEKLINKAQTEENKAKIEHALDKLKPEEKEKLQKLAPKVGKLFKKLF